MNAQDTAWRIISTPEPQAERAGVALQQPAMTIRGCVEQAMRDYFEHLDGHEVTGIYDMVLAEVEQPLLEVVLAYTRNNQSRAAEVLGLNRGTLRKMLKKYDML